ncbi:hypothetical protein Scep_027912 [Stephania cephalantha]|uniref:CCHC-type domain-containing protein n=1 Tax=Stephania cephalantha TaxID=152367 RepID=A0AAP0HMZ5_9MAGN
MIMKEKETIQKFSDRLMNVVNKIRLMGEDLSDCMIVEKVFLSLPERFEAKISSLEDSRDTTKMMMPELINALQAQEQRRMMRNEAEDKAVEGAYIAKAPLSKVRGRNIQCIICKKMGHDENDCWHKGKPQCYNCKKFGHVQKHCRFKKEEYAKLVEATTEEDLF